MPGQPLITAVLLSALVATALTAPPQTLQLRFSPGALTDGVPDNFTIEIVNASDHDIRLPYPLIECGSSHKGSIWIQLKFTAVNPVPISGTAFGCFADLLHQLPILDRVHEWPLLHPGDTLRETASKEELHYEGHEPGTYEFRAVYTPPAIDPADRKILREADIDVPSAPVTSAHLTFQRVP